MSVEQTAEKVVKQVKTEEVVNELVQKVRSGETVSTLKELWNNHQDDIIRFGKILILSVIILALAWLIARIIKRIIIASTGRVITLDDSLTKIIGKVVNVLVWSLALLIILDLFGVNTASILTVLGAAGLAIGLAMKDSLSNISAGLMLLFLRPYKLGDFVDCGSVSGTIVEIGLFTTVLSTVDGVFISAPNSSIFGNPIKNYSRNPIRRADIVVGIAYGDSLPKALEVLNAFLKKNPMVLQDPQPQVLVSELADSSVNITLRYWSSTEDYWNVYWELKEQLKEVIESAGLNIPFPQRVVTMVTDGAK